MTARTDPESVHGELIAPDEPRELVKAPEIDVAALFELAVKQGESGVAALERLVDLRDRMDAKAARVAFAAAKSAFQDDCPPVPKMTRGRVDRGSGTVFTWDYADLDTIQDHVKPHLRRHGFSYTWNQAVDGAGGTMTVTFVLRHINGHEESNSMTLPAKWSAGGLSEQQKFSSTETLARRRTMIAGLALSQTDRDTDGAPAAGKITESQAADIRALLDEVGGEAKFLKWLGVGAVEEIDQVMFTPAVRSLEAKRRASK